MNIRSDEMPGKHVIHPLGCHLISKNSADTLKRAPHARSELRRGVAAFTLMEVMIASALFFMATFAILEMITQGLRAAHSLTQTGPTAGIVHAEFSLTNKLEEGSESGDFGDIYPGYSWSRDISFYASNGLFRVDYIVYKNGEFDSTMSCLTYAPASAPGRLTGGLRR